MSFENLGLGEPLLRAIRAEGYQTATPIQLQAIPHVLQGRDLIACAQTGTGKTAAFALPTLHRLRSCEVPAAQERRHHAPRRIRALVLSPTRELAAQIGESFSVYGKFAGLRYAVVFGGVSQVPQVRALRSGVDTLVATPGRLLDLMGQRCVDLSGVEILILDEADRMLDMGFIHALRRIVGQVPPCRQTLMFSATVPPEIRRLAAEWLRDPVHVEIAPPPSSAEQVQQCVYFIEPKQKPLLLAHFLQNTPSTRTLVFARTKHGADKIVRYLTRAGITAAAIHGNKSQAARQRVLLQFKSEQPPVLVATDVAARGLDIDSISHVINYDLPVEPETYIHRIGRTGRAGATGSAVSFCGRDERSRLQSIERLIRRSIFVEHRQPDFPRDVPPPNESPPAAAVASVGGTWKSPASLRVARNAKKGQQHSRRKSRLSQRRRAASAQQGGGRASTNHIGHVAKRRRGHNGSSP